MDGFITDCKELVDNLRELADKLRNDRARYICDDEFDALYVTLDCVYAADAIERLLRDLEKQQIENRYMKTELEFTREFISRNGLQYALMADLNKETTAT